MTFMNFTKNVGPCLLILFLSSGCGPSRPETAEVRGRVTFQGKPVPEGRILFWPPNGRPAMAEIQPDGTYELMTFDEGDGAVLGEHRVTIKATHTHFPRREQIEGGRRVARAAAL